MQAINRGATEDALRLIDESHAQLLDDRRTLQAVEAALHDLAPVPQERGDTFVGPWREGSASAQPPCANGNAPVIVQVRSAGGVAPLESMLRDWNARLSARSRAMLTGAAALDAYLACRPAPARLTGGSCTDPPRPSHLVGTE